MLRRRGVIFPAVTRHPPYSARVPWIASALIVVTALSAGVSLAPSAVADPTTNFRDAVASARDETSCGHLQYNAVAEHVAEIINRSTDDYLNQVATRVPITDPLEGLKDLGYEGTKAYLLQGANESDANAIKGALLQGYAAIPDCSYTDFGVSLRRNERTGYILASVVLAGT